MGSIGYLLDFSDFQSILAQACQWPEEFKDVHKTLNIHHWTLSKDEKNEIQISIQGIAIDSLEKAYEVFKHNEKLHRSLYSDAMTHWR